ncbi:NUDIX hydrolase domain-like protein [Gongronella butleri]|nr:NUDIX hydrolase domain-like protein [Gongronella butleri]
MSLANLRNLCENLQTKGVLNITSPAQYPRRAAVVAILRWHATTPPDDAVLHTESPSSTPTHPLDVLKQWQDTPGHLEILYIQRAKRKGDVWSGQVAFPGGKNEPEDTKDVETATREVHEEIGLDLTDTTNFLQLGKLDDKQVYKELVVVPFVFLQISPVTPPLAIQDSEVAAVYWISLKYLLHAELFNFDPWALRNHERRERWPLASENKIQVPSIVLPVQDEQEMPVILWGLTLRMSQQLFEFAVTDVVAEKSRL